MQKDISELNSEKYYDDTLNPQDIIYYISMLQTFHILKKSFEIQTNLISQDIVCQQIFSKSLANDRQGLPPTYYRILSDNKITTWGILELYAGWTERMYAN